MTKGDIVLMKPVEEAKQLLGERIVLGTTIIKELQNDKISLDKAKSDYRKWAAFNQQLLSIIFQGQSIIDEYNYATGQTVFKYVPYSDPRMDEEGTHISTIERKIEVLESISERLPLFIINLTVKTSANKAVINRNDNVFVVHGHNDAVKYEVARTIEKIGLHAIILHEQANGGKTIIEKLEANSGVGFAVIILSADDQGQSKSEEIPRDRARQNVILELGYFIGAIGRENVCCLYEEGVELPSDIMGVLYIPIDKAKAWQYLMTKEIKSAGYNVSLDSLN